MNEGLCGQKQGAKIGASLGSSQATLEALSDLILDLREEVRFLSASQRRTGPAASEAMEGESDDADDLSASRRNVTAPLPDPGLVRELIRQRRLREQFFDRDLFADPAWDMLLDLTAARVERKRVSVTSLCIASNVPLTTALRWIRCMIEAGLFVREDDELDRRRSFIGLTDKGARAMADYFAQLDRRGRKRAFRQSEGRAA